MGLPFETATAWLPQGEWARERQRGFSGPQKARDNHFLGRTALGQRCIPLSVRAQERRQSRSVNIHAYDYHSLCHDSKILGRTLGIQTASEEMAKIFLGLENKMKQISSFKISLT